MRTDAPTRLRPVLWAALLCLLAVTGCKSSLHADLKDRQNRKKESDMRQRPYLGIVVHRSDSADEKGVPIERVLRSSPADDAGVRPGDVLLRLGARAVNSTSDIAEVMSPGSAIGKKFGDEVDSGPGDPQLEELWQSLNVRTTSRIELTILRNGEKIVIPTHLRSSWDYVERAAERMSATLRENKSSFYIPFLIDYETLAIQPDVYLAYMGQKIKEPYVIYTDFDLIPVLGVFSLFRLETAARYVSAWRLQITTWPVVFTHHGDDTDAYTESLLVEGEESYIDY